MAGILTTLHRYRQNRAVADKILAEEAKAEAEKKNKTFSMSAMDFQKALSDSLRKPQEKKR